MGTSVSIDRYKHFPPDEWDHIVALIRRRDYLKEYVKSKKKTPSQKTLPEKELMAITWVLDLLADIETTEE